MINHNYIYDEDIYLPVWKEVQDELNEKKNQIT